MTELITSIKDYAARRSSDKYALVLCGFGGSIWQLKRLINVLRRLGYNVTAMDFSEHVLSKGDPTPLLQLADEVVAIANTKQKELDKPVLLVGISLGALLSLNILRRSKQFHKAVLITGGDIVKVAKRLYGDKVWPQPYDELAKTWQDVNMYTDPTRMRGVSALMVLPTKDRLIDPDDVRNEIMRQQQAGNNVHLIERRLFGHIGTIIEEAVLFPNRTKGYLKQVQ